MQPTSAMGLGSALDAFCAGKAAEGLSPRTITWYRMIGERLIGRFGAEPPVDTLTPTGYDLRLPCCHSLLCEPMPPSPTRTMRSGIGHSSFRG